MDTVRIKALDGLPRTLLIADGAVGTYLQIIDHYDDGDEVLNINVPRSELLAALGVSDA